MEKTKHREEMKLMIIKSGKEKKYSIEYVQYSELKRIF